MKYSPLGFSCVCIQVFLIVPDISDAVRSLKKSLAAEERQILLERKMCAQTEAGA